MTHGELRQAVQEILSGLVDMDAKVPPGASFWPTPLTPAQRRLVAARLRDLADRLAEYDEERSCD